MNDIYKILNKNFKYIFIFSYLIWITLIFFYVSNSSLIKAGELHGLVLYGSDSISYIKDAKRFLNLDFSDLHTSKLSYIFFITFVLSLNLGLTSIVIFQFFTTIISSFCLYLICKKLFSKWVGVTCLFLFLTYLPIQLRNFYILTEILFINLSIILVYLCFFKQSYKTSIILISLFILFLRPQGFLIILSLFFTIIIFKKFNGIYNLLLKLGLFLISFFIIIFFINIGIKDYELINSLSRGIIWGYSFDTNSICKKECIKGFSNPELYKKNIFEFFLYLKDNFLIITKVAFFKLTLYFSGWRPYYSNLHNIYIVLIHVPIFFLFVAYFLKTKKLYSLETFIIFYIGLSVIFVSVTFVDWSGRFIMYILPFMMIFASKSMIDLVSFSANNLKK